MLLSSGKRRLSQASDEEGDKENASKKAKTEKQSSRENNLEPEPENAKGARKVAEGVQYKEEATFRVRKQDRVISEDEPKVDNEQEALEQTVVEGKTGNLRR